MLLGREARTSLIVLCLVSEMVEVMDSVSEDIREITGSVITTSLSEGSRDWFLSSWVNSSKLLSMASSVFEFFLDF